mmetsp:Transcript_103206/g.321631  ORF Transcript_103206/g.321631 Transcript_103206/m.321631 type:complete len:204 (-) Transcript_103206:307-918(-)
MAWHGRPDWKASMERGPRGVCTQQPALGLPNEQLARRVAGLQKVHHQSLAAKLHQLVPATAADGIADLGRARRLGVAFCNVPALARRPLGPRHPGARDGDDRQGRAVLPAAAPADQVGAPDEVDLDPGQRRPNRKPPGEGGVEDRAHAARGGEAVRLAAPPAVNPQLAAAPGSVGLGRELAGCDAALEGNGPFRAQLMRHVLV